VYLNESSIVDETLLLKAIYKLPDPWPKCLTCDKPFDPKKKTLEENALTMANGIQHMMTVIIFIVEHIYCLKEE